MSRIDGLPARILTVMDIRPYLLPGDKCFDLIPAFKEMGFNIVAGETAIYHAESRSLLRNLSEENHQRLKEVIANLYRTDNLLHTYRVYLDLLEPLTGEERLKVVKRIGFLPDPLVSSLIAETREVTSDEWRQESDRKTLALLNIALDRMKSQIAVMEAAKTEQTAPLKGIKSSD
jgi:hypothetical protein